MSEWPSSVDVGAYERFMGRYSRPLAQELAAAAGVAPGDRVLDVGCGPGALSGTLAELVGPERLAAVDPSDSFVEGCRERVPGADVRLGPAEVLPFADDTFDRSLAQLVFQFVADRVSAAAEMARVTRPGGTVAACVWDATGGMTMFRAYWDAVVEAGAGSRNLAERFGGRPGQLAGLWRDTGLRDVAEGSLTVTSRYRDFEELWAAFVEGVGPIGVHAASLDGDARDAVREALYRGVGAPAGSFELAATAWYATGLV